MDNNIKIKMWNYLSGLLFKKKYDGVESDFYFYTIQFIQCHSFVLYQINNSHGKNVYG